ncbi:MAG: valine--tRNA ligase, partial [Firmicutes bacterium]|nr:valine--tRNA ligase [Bacillota bacterium]
CARSVRETFCDLYEKGLIYKGSRIINWCPNCRTALSDAEVEYKDMPGFFWHIKYPLEDSDDFLTIATTRPETMLGDSGIAVHPDDDQYKHLVGKNAILPLVGRKLPIVADDYVELGFGTGAVKMTPCHDPNDYEVGLRHNLEQIQVIDEGACIMGGNKYDCMDRYEARKAIVADLEAEGYLVKTEPHNHNVGCCYRCGTVVEPLTSPQWFVSMKPLAEAAIEVVKDGRIKFVPERFTKTYLNWMENVHDWCISRQLWWGHQIPAWYCADCGETIVAKDDPTVCPKCGGAHLDQDPDVLDTWFSSGLWPFSTLGWPDQTQLLKDFYPTSVLVTGYDIIFFWVARMIFSGLEQMDEHPFDDVFIHGIVRDELGRKMSKSLGNGVDPLEIIAQYGADSLRFMLMTGIAPGNDTRFKPERLEGARNFLNKLFNATRFALMNLEDYEEGRYPLQLTLADKWILERLRITAIGVNENMEKYELGEAARMIYDFSWDEFCDWYVEIAKARLYRGTPEERHTAQTVLATVLSHIMELLHPFTPFVTEDLWQKLPHNGETIMLAKYPNGVGMDAYEEEAQQMQQIMDCIRAIRNIRAEMGVQLGKKADVIFAAEPQLLELVKTGESYIMSLASAASVTLEAAGFAAPAQSAKAHVRGIDIFLPLAGVIDIDKEIARIEKEIAACDADIARLSSKLNNESFIGKAPAAVVEKERNRLKECEDKRVSLVEHLQLFK